MPITPPAAYVVVPKSALMLAPMAGPLGAVLDNTNHLYVRHRPALVSHAITVSRSAADRSYVLPLAPPSADDLRYDFRICVWASAVGAVDLQLDYSNDATVAGAAWNNLDTSPGWVTANGFAVYTVTGVLPGTAQLLKLETAGATVDVRVTHLFAAPDPDTAADPFDPGGASLASRFRVHDGALVGTADRPVTTELVDRTRRNAIILLQDRAQMVASMLSPDDRATSDTKAPQAWATAGAWIVVGRCVAFLPPSAGNGTTLTVLLYATASGGGTADRVSVEAFGGPQGIGSVQLDASGSVETGSLFVVPSAEGMIDLQVRVKALAGQTVAVHGLTVYWSAGSGLDSTQRLTGSGYLVAADGTLLAAADGAVRDVALALYAAPGHMADGASSGRTNSQAHVVVPRAVQDLRLVAYRTTDGAQGTPFAAATKLFGTVDGSIAAPADCVVVPCPLSGADTYFDCTAALPPSDPPALLVAGEVQVAVPAGEQDRTLNVTEDLVTSIELVEVERTASWCLRPCHRTADIETL